MKYASYDHPERGKAMATISEPGPAAALLQSGGSVASRLVGCSDDQGDPDPYSAKSFKTQAEWSYRALMQARSCPLHQAWLITLTYAPTRS